MLLAERARADRLSQIIKELQRHRFGRRAETLPLEQLELGLEDVQQVEAAGCIASEDVSERIDIIPAQIRVLVTRRPNYACRSCEEGVVQAPAPAPLIEGALPTEATVVPVVVAKYADHLPLYRQAQIYARQA